MKHYFTTIIVLINFILINGQERDKKIDSLLKISESTIFREFNDSIDSKPFLLLIKKADGIKNKNQKADVNYQLASYYTAILDYKKRDSSILLARKIYREQKDWGNYIRTSKSLAMIYRRKGEIGKMEGILKEAIAIAEQKNIGFLILKPLQEITIHYSYDLNQPENAIIYGQKFFKELNKYKKLEINNPHFNYSEQVESKIVALELGRSYLEKNQLDSARIYLKIAKDFFIDDRDDTEKALRILTHYTKLSIKSNDSKKEILKNLKLLENENKKSRKDYDLKFNDTKKLLEESQKDQEKLLKQKHKDEDIKRNQGYAIVVISLLLLFTLIVLINVARITRIKNKLNKKLEEEKDLLESVDRDRNMQLSIIAHELRTPIFTAKGLLSMDDPKKSDFNAIKNSVNYLHDTIKNILSLPILKNKNSIQQSLIIKNFELIPYVKKILDSHNYLANHRRIKLNFEYDNKLETVKIKGIEQNLGHVLSNLVHNAIKFSPLDNIIQITIKTIERNKENIRLHFSVKDNGNGISEENISKIFEYRKKDVDDTNKNTSKTEGLGIGLYIVQKILTSQNSSIKIDTRKNIGTTFSFEINYEIANSLEAETRHTISKNHKITNILIIDDNKLNGIVAKKIVEKTGLSAHFCTDEEDYLSIIKEKKIDFIITDINMPKINGFEITKIIKSNFDIKVIAHTAADDIHMQDARIKDSGIDEILIKPYTENDFSKIVNKLYE